MKQYPTLYSKDSKGNIRVWKMEQSGPKYRTVSGIEGGKEVVSEWTVATEKNSEKSNRTSPEEQASIEIEAKYEKQLKTGYFSNKEDVDRKLFVEPMLAKKFVDRLDKVVYPVIVDIKFNGSRCVSHKRGLFTRKGEPYKSVPHIQESLAHLFNRYPDLVVDGELYNHDYRHSLNEIMKLVRKTVNVEESDLLDSRNKIKYYVYDFYGAAGVSKDTKQFERREVAKSVFKHLEFIEIVEGKIANNEQEVWEIYNDYVSDGYEGAMVRLNAGYENKRSSNLLKAKPEDDAEGIIVDILEGQGNWSGTGKIITLNWNGLTFNATFKGTQEEGAKFLKEKNNWIGKEVTFLYNGLTGLKVPNFARVDINNCLKK